ncbi:MAG: CpaF family protein [Actinomycetia bacterium]|nr:CpaF family protein [Actinomycetes bacterium]
MTCPQLIDELHRLVAGSPEGYAAADLAEEVRCRDPLLPAASVARIVEAVTARVGGLGSLEPLLADPEIDEIMVNAGPVWVERKGQLQATGLRLTTAEIEGVAERILSPLGVVVDRAHPLADARLPDGSRLNVVLPPLAIDGPHLTIRRFGARAIDLGDITGPEGVDLLERAVAERRNIVVSGGTGTGKTTVLNALAGRIGVGERLVTVEDTAELRLRHDHVVRLESRAPTADGPGIDLRVLVRNALRMRPDRIIVGEVRGSEVLDMLQALNTGHEGSLTTVHSNSPDDAIRRLEMLALAAAPELPLVAVRELLHSTIDLVVHLVRRIDGSRLIAAMAEPVAVERLGDGGARMTPVAVDPPIGLSRPARREL